MKLPATQVHFYLPIHLAAFRFHKYVLLMFCTCYYYSSQRPSNMYIKKSKVVHDLKIIIVIQHVLKWTWNNPRKNTQIIFQRVYKTWKYYLYKDSFNLEILFCFFVFFWTMLCCDTFPEDYVKKSEMRLRRKRTKQTLSIMA